MPALLRSPRARWALPVAVVTAIGGAVGAGALLAGATSPDLPDRTPAELIAAAAESDQAFSGTVVQTSRLGLPELPGLAEHGDTSLASILTGSNTARLWYSPPDRTRFALMGAFDEVNLIRDGAEVWLWTSSTNTAEHIELPPGLDLDPAEAREHLRAPLTPLEAAEHLLGAIDPTTQVTVDGTAEVAGRAAYELVLTPRDDGSLVEDIRLSVDAETSMPLRVELNARGDADPAFEIGFTSVTFDPPPDDVFRFTPPPGATVTEHSLDELLSMGDDASGDHPGDLPGDHSRPTVIGEGWTSVLVLDDVDLPDLGGSPDRSGESELGLDVILDAATPVSGDYGSGLLFQTALVSALWLDDGTLLVGAVTPDILEAAAADVAEEGAP